jgi:hypothetical protein
MVDFTACEEESRKASDKYRSASFAKPDAAVVKRRWRIFLAVEVVLVICFVALSMFPGKSGFTPILGGLLGPLLAFSLPVAFLYLIGKPPVMTLDPDCTSAETRAMTKDVRRRAPLSDDEFYSQFYEASAIQKDTIARIRLRLRKNIDRIAERLVPTDYLPLIWEWLDFADLFYVLDREFGVNLGDEGTFNGTLDSLIRLVDERIQNEANTVDRRAAEK